MEVGKESAPGRPPQGPATPWELGFYSPCDLLTTHLKPSAAALDTVNRKPASQRQPCQKGPSWGQKPAVRTQNTDSLYAQCRPQWPTPESTGWDSGDPQILASSQTCPPDMGNVQGQCEIMSLEILRSRNDYLALSAWLTSNACDRERGSNSRRGQKGGRIWKVG
jgi:hypothetical protein